MIPLLLSLLATAASAAGNIEQHQVHEVSENVAHLRRVAPAVAQSLAPVRMRARIVEDTAYVQGPHVKIIHWIRHGEGTHNVAQREWRANPAWDGHSEPYTIDNDPGPPFKYGDAELTELGVAQAKSLVDRTMAMPAPELLVVSPLRRATQTGLHAFAPLIANGLPVVAHEGAHEIAGFHTCDRRLSTTKLAAQFPEVDFSLLESEDDFFFGDGTTRESWEAIAQRAADFAVWLRDRPEKRIAVASHSVFLLTLFNAVFETPDTEEGGKVRAFFGTGEMRTTTLMFLGGGHHDEL